MFFKVLPARPLDRDGEQPMAIDIYDRLGDIAFTFGIFAAKAYFAIALI